MDFVRFSSIAFQTIRCLTLSIFAASVGVLITPLLTKFLYKHHLRKHIETRANAPVFMSLHKNKEGTPTMGGVLMWGTTLLLALIFLLLSHYFDGFWGHMNFVSRSQTWLPLGAMVGAAIIGLADDLMGIFHFGHKGTGLKVVTKILLYTSIAIIGAWWFYGKLGYHTLYIPFHGEVNLGINYILYFIFVLVATTFSMNETDGLDGLAGGISLIGFSALLMVAFTQGLYNLAAFLSVLIGTIVAFLWFNVHPARFFMGDTGSMSLGVTMGIVAMLTDTSLFLPLFAFILVVESLSVLIQTTSKKVRHKKVFLSTPIHHHFEAKGWPESKVTMRFWIISGVAAILGLILYFLDMFFI